MASIVRPATKGMILVLLTIKRKRSTEIESGRMSAGRPVRNRFVKEAAYRRHRPMTSL